MSPVTMTTSAEDSSMKKPPLIQEWLFHCHKPAASLLLSVNTALVTDGNGSGIGIEQKPMLIP